MTPSRFSVTAQGIVYRSVSGLQGYYPRIICLGEDELLASFVAGVALESSDSHLELSRSFDGGITWTADGPLDKSRPAICPPTETGFISHNGDGSLFCLGSRWPIDPADPDRPVIHPQTVGMRENQIVLRRSADGGRTWTALEILPPPFQAPLEVPTGLWTLADGTHIFSFSTWKRWNGSCPYGHRVAICRSTDQCRTWGDPITIFHDTSGRVGYWEGRIGQLEGNTLLATCWAHDWETDQDLPNPFALSYDGGCTWTPQLTSPVRGQTGWPLPIEGDRLLFVYNHRQPPVGIRAQLARIVDKHWMTIFDEVIWSPVNTCIDTITSGAYGVNGFQFGAPSAIKLVGDEILLSYWCVTGGRSGIEWTRLVLA